jgi:PhoPQ-activated pathogenicity-related protein
MRLVSLCTLVALGIVQARADLYSFIAQPEPETSWSLVSKSESNGCEISVLKLKSQVWQGIPWEHDLVLFRPKNADITDKMFLLNNGGSLRADSIQQGVAFALMTKAPVAALLGIPKQPLFDGKSEDDLIAETFVRFLDTKDDKWPLLFPMVKSLVKAMDAIQEFSSKEWSKRIEKFAVGGASKRGWTSWLTAAVDPRVMAITPMVIDVLKMPEQMKHQIECFGAPSEQIRPYCCAWPGTHPRYGGCASPLGVDRPVDLPCKIHHAEARGPGEQRPLLDDGCVESLLGRPPGSQVDQLHPERGP